MVHGNHILNNCSQIHASFGCTTESFLFPTPMTNKYEEKPPRSYAHMTSTGGMAHGSNIKYSSSATSCVIFQGFLNNKTGLPQRSFTTLTPNSFPSASAFSMASQPPPTQRACVNPRGSIRESTPYSAFKRYSTTYNENNQGSSGSGVYVSVKFRPLYVCVAELTRIIFPIL